MKHLTQAGAPQGGKQRRGRPGYDRESLLRSAVLVFHERGYDGTSMDDVAASLGVTKSAIYHHVRSKEELLRLSVDHALDALFAVLAEERADAGAPVERLRYVVRRSVEVLVEELPFVTLLLRVRGNSTVEVGVLERRREFDQRVGALVAAAVADGSLRCDVDPALATRLLFGMVNSLTEWYRPGGTLDAEQVATALTAVAFDGLGARVVAESPTS